MGEFLPEYQPAYKFRVRTFVKGKKYTIQVYCRFGNAKKKALKNKDRWVEGLIGKSWYELSI